MIAATFLLNRRGDFGVRSSGTCLHGFPDDAGSEGDQDGSSSKVMVSQLR